MMIAFLLLISIVLHFFTFFIMIVLFRKFRQTISIEEIEQQKRQIEDLLSAYAFEMKEENEQFLDRLKDRFSKEKEPLMSKAEEYHGQLTEYISPKANESEYYEPSLQAKVFNLFQEGYTANDIAKKLNKGKGEIELLLKFHR